MSSNCQMANIFAPFHQRINCRAAWGLRCTDHSDPDYPPLESPHGGGRGVGGGSCNSYSPNHFPIKPSGPFGLHTPKCKAAQTVDLVAPLRSGTGGEKQLQTPAKTMGFSGHFQEMLDQEADEYILLMFWIPEGRWPRGFESSAPLLGPLQLLVYMSVKEVIELNKAFETFLGGSCSSCCLWRVKRPCDIENTYTCRKLVGQIGGHDDRAVAASATWGPQLWVIHQQNGATFRPSDYEWQCTCS